MFIARSMAKVRVVRTLFVLLGILPCVTLVGWAWVRHSSSYRDGIQRHAERAIGMPVEIGGVEHLRPGTMRLRGCSIALPSEGGTLRVSEVEVESSASEIRLRIPDMSCDPASVAALARVARAWLDEPVRFPHACIIDIGSLAWDVDGLQSVRRDVRGDSDKSLGVPVRVECVSAGDSRAVQVRRTDGIEGENEIRVIAVSGTPRTYEARASIRDAIPFAVVGALLPSAIVAALPIGPADAVTGRLESSTAEGVCTGQVSGMIRDIDMGRFAGPGQHRLEGVLALSVERLSWNGEQMVTLEAKGSAGRGRVCQSLLDALATKCGCRKSSLFPSLAGEEMWPFDDIEVTVKVDAEGVRIAAGPNRDGAIARAKGLSLLGEPTGLVPIDRLAWLVGPVDAPAVPGSAAATWLMQILPPPAQTGPRVENRTIMNGNSLPQAREF